MKNDPFIKKYERADVNVGEWFANAVRQADAVAQAAARYVAWLVSVFPPIFFARTDFALVLFLCECVFTSNKYI